MSELSYELKDISEKLKLPLIFLEKSPYFRRDVLEAMGKVLLDELRAEIKKEVKDTHGHVAGLQDMVIGSGAGYVAVRPKADTLAEGVEYHGETVSARRFTTWLDKGHATRRWDRRRFLSDHNDMYFIPGKLFYSRQKSNLKFGRTAVWDAARKVLDDFAPQLEEGRERAQKSVNPDFYRLPLELQQRMRRR